MVDGGASPATIRKHLGALSSLLQLAVDNGLCATNVARGVRVRGAKVAQAVRQPYDAEDLKHIFATPVYTEGFRPEAGAGAAAYWLPLLALFTGARLEELGQARVEDVKESEGVRFLDISDAGQGKSLKTVSSRRRVPIHPELVRLGFLNYVDERKRAVDERLFPDLKQDRFGKWTQNWSKWWGRYARDQAKIDDPRKVFHSFRHTFKHACRASGIPEDIHDALTGHSSGSGVGRTYGGAYPLKPLATAMKKLRYPGLHLMDLKKDSDAV
jgi:integrase